MSFDRAEGTTGGTSTSEDILIFTTEAVARNVRKPRADLILAYVHGAH